MKAHITLTPTEAREYERKHDLLRLKLVKMHLNGTEMYEIIHKELKSYGNTDSRKGPINY